MMEHGVDIMYTNHEVYENGRFIRHQIFRWLMRLGQETIVWQIMDRDPDDHFKGETFQFANVSHAIMFKLAWGGTC